MWRALALDSVPRVASFYFFRSQTEIRHAFLA